MTHQKVDNRPPYMDSNNSVLCGRCVFDALKIRDDPADVRSGQQQYESARVLCAASTDAAAYVALREHNATAHKSARILAAIVGQDDKWHLIDVPEPIIQL